jgi:mRNA (guanine-N7-)-methyltransferase
MEPFQAR